jgi:hypothetical protein
MHPSMVNLAEWRWKIQELAIPTCQWSTFPLTRIILAPDPARPRVSPDARLARRLSTMRRFTFMALALAAACSGGHDRIKDTALATVLAAKPPASPPPSSVAPPVA